MAPLRVLICGAGICGPALAFWLSRLDCDITVIERVSDIRATGQQIDFRAQGIGLMKKMGIEPAVRAKLVKEPGTWIVNPNGYTLGYFKANHSGTGRQGPTSEFEIMRGDVVQILYDATKNLSKVKYLFGVYVESFTQELDNQTGGNLVHVYFSNRMKGAYDLLVGADGISSRTRRLMLAPEDDSKILFQLGVHVAFYSIPVRPNDPYELVGCQLGNGLFLATRHDSKDVLRALIMARGDFPNLDKAYRSGDVLKIKQAWAFQLEGVGWQGKRFQDGLLNETISDDIYAQRLAQVKLPEGKWSNGNVVLIGDAAGCAPVGSGLGSTISLATAYVLAGEIARNCFKKAGEVDTNGLGPATKEYERKMRPFIREAQDMASPAAMTAMMPGSRLEVWFWSLVVVVISLLMKLRFDVLIEFFITPSAEKWEVPFYPELEKEKKNINPF